MDKERIKQLKLQGFLNQKNKDYFSVRVVTNSGNVNGNKMNKLVNIANEYGRGYMGFTSRMCIEIPWIHKDDVDKVKEELIKDGIRTGGTGKKLRPIVACKGTVCQHGNIDTQKIGDEIDREFYGRQFTPHKFKLGIAGCPNNCIKAQLNDLGIMGQRLSKYNEEKCVGCGLCVKACKVNAITKVGNKVVVNREECTNCGKCIDACKLGAMELEKQGAAIFIGGRFGKKYRIGDRLDGIYDVKDINKIVGIVMDYFEQHGECGERFAVMMERIGVDKVKCDIMEKIQNL
ncbi:4Fe-4S binding protein [Haloimpatiens sp. FM7330]|uniref:4Fe-4S binding protein n=1 Tax=Haloimpatiens sp. FM7330 TaxID=3298610 RepID=UPI00362847B1